MSDDLSDFHIRNMVRADLEYVLRWSIAEGWNIGMHDHDVFFATDPNGFFIGELNGEAVGAVSGVAYGDLFGFIGMYIVYPELRGKGYGLKLFDTAMQYLSKRTVGLDGVIAQQDNYRRSGFQLAHRNIRYQWIAPGSLTASQYLVPASSIPFDLLADFDSAHFPARRDGFLTGWIHEPESMALVGRTDGAITSFGMIRKFHRGCCIGPLFANSDHEARQMFESLCAYRAGEQVFLDVPEPNSAAVAMAESYGMTPVFETARMYRGADPQLPLDRIYGITSFELG